MDQRWQTKDHRPATATLQAKPDGRCHAAIAAERCKRDLGTNIPKPNASLTMARLFPVFPVPLHLCFD